MSNSGKKGSMGSVGCGCFLWVFVLIAWIFCYLIFPKLPDYDEVMRNGESVPGKVLRVETVENVTINGKNPRNVFFSYGEGQEGSMRMALKESANKDQEITVRVMGDLAYPENIRPFKKPSWFNMVLIGGAILGAVFIGLGVIRLLIIGGLLFAAGRAIKKDNQAPPSSPPPL